jgi:hypothetical protein
VAPARTGDGWDLGPDPGLDLRMTHVLRTYRLAYAAGDAVTDAGWIRPATDVNGFPAAVRYWPDGEWILGARAEGARTDGYVAAGEMIESAGDATIDGAVTPIVRRARYWIAAGALASAPPVPFPLLDLRRLGSEVLPLFVIPS